MPSTGYGVVVLLNSYTPMTKHPFEISAGIIDLTEDVSPTPGPPIATILDFVLAAITALVALAGVFGIRRAGQWADGRSQQPTWRFGLRLLPQIVSPVLAIYVFAVLPALDGNSATPVDALGLFPAVMILLAVTAVVGATLTATRIVHRLTTTSDTDPTSTNASTQRA